MCGRFSLTLPVEAMGRLFGFDERPNLEPRHNIAPSQDIAIVRRREDGAGRALALVRWGFVPAWARDPDSGPKPINARAESVSGKPTFRDAFLHRRCLIPADGFYEWKPEAGGKQPWRIVRADGAPFAFAGLWERWRGKDGGLLETAVIITTEANEALAPIHKRMPVMLDIGRFAPWLEASPAEASELMEPYRGDLRAFPVSRRVNDPHNDDADIIEPLPIAGGATEITEPDEGDGEPTLI